MTPTTIMNPPAAYILEIVLCIYFFFNHTNGDTAKICVVTQIFALAFAFDQFCQLLDFHVDYPCSAEWGRIIPGSTSMQERSKLTLDTDSSAWLCSTFR